VPTRLGDSSKELSIGVSACCVMLGPAQELCMIPFSILDLAPIAEGATAADAFRNSLELAQHAEQWGTGGSGWPNTTTCRASPAPRRRSSLDT